MGAELIIEDFDNFFHFSRYQCKKISGLKTKVVKCSNSNTKIN